MGNLRLDISVINRTNAKFLYKDISVPLPDNFSAIYDLVAIQKSISNIFKFRRGERILDPSFGNMLYYHVYDTINDLAIINIKGTILKMLAYEPRIQVLSVNVTPDMDNNQINVVIQYAIPHLNMTGTFSTVITILTK